MTLLRASVLPAALGALLLVGCGGSSPPPTVSVAKHPTRELRISVRVRRPDRKLYLPSNGASPGDLLEYRIEILNAGTTQLSHVSVADHLPRGTRFMFASAEKSTIGAINETGSNEPASDSIAKGGADLGSFPPGASTYVYLRARVAPGVKSGTVLRDVAVVRSAGTGSARGVAVTRVR